MSLWDELILPAGTLDQLRRDASAERPTHAWLFTGAAGAPHRRAALIFAAALLCEQPNPADRGCGTCKGCVTVLNGSHSDFTHFRTEAVSISIDDARDLVMKAQDRPSVGRWRVILMEDTERMPERTSNVLLKAVEEPPPHTIWLLTAPSPTDVLVTIRSRCRPVQLPVPAIADVAAKLAADGIEDALARHAATLAQGDAEVAARLAHDPAALQRRETLPLLIMNIRSISSAYAAADRLITLAEQDAAEAAAARDEKERTELLAILGITEGARISPSLRSQVRRLEDEQKRRAKRIQSDTLLRSMTEIQTVLRDVLTLQLNSGSALMNEHARDALAEFAARTSAAQTLEHVQALEVVLGRLRTNANARLLIEGFMGRFVL